MFLDLKIILSCLDKKLKRKLVLIFILSLFGTILEALGVGIILPFLKLIIEGKESIILMLSEFNFEFLNEIFFIKISDQSLIIYSLFLLILLFLFKTIFFIYLIWQQNIFAYNVESTLAKKLLSFYLKQDYSFHLLKNSSELFRNIIDEVRTFRISVINPILILITEVLILIFISSLVIFIAPLIAISTSIFLIICTLAYLKFSQKKLTKLGDERQIHDALRIQHLKQGLMGIKEIKISGNENEFLSIFDVHNLKSIKTRSDQHFWTGIPRFVLEFIVVLAFIGLSFLAVSQGYQIKNLLPVIGLFAVASFRLLPSVSKIIQSENNIRFGYPSLKLLSEEFKNIKKKETIVYQESKNNKPLDFENLNLSKVTFKYPKSKTNVLENINLEIKKGDKIAIVGESGSGKSSFIDIVSGLIEPSSGEIKLNGKKINLNNKNWFDIISYVPQFTFLTDDTIIRNIAFGIKDKDIDTSKIKKILSVVELNDFVKDSNKGLETMIGEQGTRISGGQKQRLGIARALYTNFQILFLDESTSALDLETENKIFENLSNYLKNKTLIMVSHRPSILSNFKKIFATNKGNLIQQNTQM